LERVKNVLSREPIEDCIDHIPAKIELHNVKWRSEYIDVELAVSYV